MTFKQRIRNVLYNEDRVVDSALGAPPQETLSSEIGRHRNTWWGKVGSWFLDHIQKNHVENAIKHADALDKVDDGKEQ